MATKHEQIIQHIWSLDIGHKISVRQIAKDLNVSDGTAYRAIKEAENQGLVSTIERVGTIRIERKERENFEHLTYAEVVNIIDGQVLGGKSGLHKTLTKFVIGAMEIEAMMRYTEENSLLIVGNRHKAHEAALTAGAAVLLTGGFDTTEAIKRLADEKELPIISTSYDTFTVASMINRAIYDQLIKKDIVFAGDVATSLDETYYLNSKDTVKQWKLLNEKSKRSRFPVVDDKLRVVGIVSARDIVGKDETMAITKIMTKKPLVVTEKTSLASVSHTMIWEGIEVIPIVDKESRLQGLVSRQDVLKALQQIQRQPQMGQTIDDLITSNLEEVIGEENVYQTEVMPQMTNPLGTLSYGVFTTIISTASSRMLMKERKADLVIENMTVFFSKPVQIESMLTIKPKLIDIGRLHAKIEVDVLVKQELIGKGLIMAQLLNR